MPFYEQNYAPGNQYTGYQGIAAGITSLGKGLTEGYQQHQKDQQMDAYNDMVFRAGIQEGRIKPEDVGLKAENNPTPEEMQTAWNGLARPKKMGIAAAANAGIVGQWQEQQAKLAGLQAELRANTQRGNLYGAQAAALYGMDGGGGGGVPDTGGAGPVLRTPTDEYGNPDPNFRIGTLHGRSSTGRPVQHEVLVRVPRATGGGEEVWHKDKAGNFFYYGANNQKIPASVDQLAAIRMAEEMQKQKATAGAQSPITPPQGGRASTPQGRVTIYGPDPNNPAANRQFTIPEQQLAAAINSGYQLVQ
jgi:hypothetical protein